MKTILSTILITATLLTSTAYATDAPVSASGFFFKPYVGADYQYSSVSYKNIGNTAYSYGDILADSFNGGDVHIGARVHQNLGFEVGYFDNASESKSNILGTNATSSAKFDGWTLDAMGYLPIGESKKFELIGTAGLAITHASATGSVTINSTTYTGSTSKTETEGRVGAGAEYWLTDNLNVRGLVRYQSADFSGLANDAVVASLGVNWQF
jgi:opacity protein-like surface antigen